MELVHLKPAQFTLISTDDISKYFSHFFFPDKDLFNNPNNAIIVAVDISSFTCYFLLFF